MTKGAAEPEDPGCVPAEMVRQRMASGSTRRSALRSASSEDSAPPARVTTASPCDAEIESIYVDTHGAIVVAFAFTDLLNFRLPPRPKSIGSICPYRPDDTTPGRPAGTRRLAGDLGRPVGPDRPAVRPDGQVAPRRRNT
jgi:hypothetical protein